MPAAVAVQHVAPCVQLEVGGRGHPGAEHLAREVGPHFEPPALLRDKVERGELGRKTGRGFYDWSPEGGNAMK